MRKIYFLLFIVCSIISLGIAAQPTVFYTNLTSTTSPALTNSRLNLSDLGTFRQCRFQTTVAPAPATQTYAFHTGTDAVPNYSNNWRPYTPADATGIAYALNTVTVPATVLNSSRWNTGGGGTDGNLAALANTTYYTVNIQENAAADNLSAIWSTTFNPVTFSGITQAPLAGSVNPGNTVTVNITSSAALGTGENVFVRYSTNGFATSSLAQATFVATAGTAVIPGLAAGTNVSYYIFSSNRTLAQLNAIVATAGIGQAGYDMATLNLVNNAGANYSYSVNAGANPVTVNATGGTPTADYGSLQTAFDAINAGTHTGAITVLINASTTEAAPSVLNASGTGAASYTSIAVNPAGGGARTIAGAIAAGSPLIDLNGADNVTFDGLNTGGNSLTIENTTVSATSGTATIRFIGGATGNTITNCFLKGAGTMSVATNGAVVFFSTDANTANGNDNNTISNCDIGPSGANLPTKAILGNGSTTTTAIGNSGIVINNNDIHDFFGAAVTSSGIAINGGCNTWAVTNNRFYQTGTRTWTTGATHRAIDFNSSTATSGVQGMTVTGNIVGYASNTQTGTYTLTGSTGKFQGIVFSGITAGTVSNVNNNTVASVSLSGVTSSGTSTSSPLIGILISNGLATTNNNTIGSQSATGSLVFSTTTTTATDVIGLYNFSVDVTNAANNTIGGISVTNAGASGTFIVFGIRINTGTGVAANLTSNLVGGTIANSIQLNATGTSSQVIGILTSNAAAVFTSNTVRNLTTNIGTGTTTAASVIGISVTNTTPNHTLSQNTIHTLTNTNTTAASIVTGIQFTGSTANVVERNFIYNLLAPTTSTAAEINGIRVAGGTTTYRNNMIALGANQAIAIGTVASNGSTVGINGFSGALGTDAFIHNSVYIGGTATSGTGNSYALNGTQTSNIRSFRDNIFVNARSNSGATGKNYAVKINGTVANPTGLTINNNIYFANGTGAVFGFYNALDVANIAAWRTAVGQDANSYESNPQFNDPTNAVPDLHLHPTNATVAEGNGVDVGVTNDFDGQTRAGLTPVDIGADAGNFVGIDLAPPAITYTPLGFSCNTADRALNGVTITDVSGVPTSGALQPRIYYRKNAGTWFSSQGTLASGTATNGTWNFTIIAADMGGLVNGDNVQYYVIAQDIAPTPNITSNPPAGLVATDVNTVTTAPTTPNNYNVVGTISGTYTVGAAGAYPTLTAAFNAYNTSCLGGPVVFSLIDAAYTTTSDTLRANPTASSTNTLTIRPAAAGTIITGNLNGPAIVLLDADYITIDGSSAGASAGACDLGGNAAIRDLTITNINAGTSAGVLSIATGVNGAQNNTVKNVNILGQDPNTTLIGIAVGGNLLGGTGADNDNVTIDNCSVRRSIFGIYNGGFSAANRNTGSKITRNDLSATTTNRIKRVGIMTFNNDGIEISYNNIGGIETTESADAVGIALGNQAIDLTITTSGEVVNAVVANNKINGVASLSTTGFSAAGITVAGGNAGANTIRNNMITGVTAPSTSPDIPAGIYVVGAAGSNTRLYFNSVAMTGDRGTVTGQTPSYGIAITGTDPTVDLRNNILYTSQIASGGGADARSYAIGMVSTTFANLNSNYNAFWSTGANDGGFRTGSLGAAAGTSYATLALWAAAVSDDANSVEVDPGFVNPLSDLHINPSVCTFKGLGTPIAGITDDYDCNGRSTTLPDIGADEFNPVVTVTTTAAGSISPGAIANESVRYTVNGATDYLYYCDRIIATLTPSGALPVSGNVTAGVRIDTGATKMGTARLYAARFYDILPVNNAATATGTVKLYFVQNEFDNYNAKALDSNYYPLPLTGGGNTDSLRILVYHGAPSGGFFPGNYAGAVEELSTADAGVSVVWNPAGNNGGGWWEVSFPANGFSGYFISSKPRSPLPIKVEYFRGSKQGSNHLLDWKVVPVNTVNGTITLERSADSRNFSSIYSITASAIRMQQPFSYNNASPLNGINYYRLKLVDDNGFVTYSSIIALTNATKGFEVINITPNPVTEGRFKLNVTAAEQVKMEIVVTDIAGRVVATQSNTLIAGFNAIDVNVNKLANGTYQVMGITAEGRTKVLQFVKQ